MYLLKVPSRFIQFPQKIVCLSKFSGDRGEQVVGIDLEKDGKLRPIPEEHRFLDGVTCIS